MQTRYINVAVIKKNNQNPTIPNPIQAQEMMKQIISGPYFVLPIVQCRDNVNLLHW